MALTAERLHEVVQELVTRRGLLFTLQATRTVVVEGPNE